MSTQTIKVDQLLRMFLAGAANLEAHKDWINELNVFPVPDGDTGTNMTLTIKAAAGEVAGLSEINMMTVAKAMSSGSLRGARGNSGVILSQLMRGFSKEIREYEELDREILSAAVRRAVETAYKAVIKPKEGTILTVARGMAEEAGRKLDEPEDLEDYLRRIIAAGDLWLERTPEMLPVLKEAGVVDSGGQGLMQVVKGALEGYLGKETDLSAVSGTEEEEEPKAAQPAAAASTAEIRFGYCTEFIINLEKPYGDRDEKKLKEYLMSIGDSLVVVSDDGIVKVHVHTNDPGLALQRGLRYGNLTRLKIDNMREEHDRIGHHEEKGFAKDNEPVDKDSRKKEKAKKEKKSKDGEVPVFTEPPKPAGFLTVSLGEGLSEIFRSLNVDRIIEGGQTMNPSANDIIKAAEWVNAETIFILPNNPNVILTAQQAANLIKDKKVFVIPSTTIPQGITALINYSSVRSEEENAHIMSEELAHVKTGEVTYAVRKTKIDGKAISKGDIMGITDNGLAAIGKDIAGVTEDMLETMVGAEDELISVYYGKDTPQEDAEALAQRLAARFPDCEVEVNYGGQPVYYYVVSVE